MDVYNFIYTVCIYTLPVVFAITLHEAAHGYVAMHFGDKTAWMLGRVTLNPAKHIDPIGTLLLPLITAYTGFAIGYAKPVPVNERNLRNPKRDMIWVAAAGPASNFVQLVIWAIVAKILLSAFANTGSRVADFWIAVSMAGIQINILIGVLNLLPIPPLDGGRIVTSLLPDPVSYRFAQVERFGFFIVVAILLIPQVNLLVFAPPVRALENLTVTLFGLNV